MSSASLSKRRKANKSQHRQILYEYSRIHIYMNGILQCTWKQQPFPILGVISKTNVVCIFCTTLRHGQICAFRYMRIITTSIIKHVAVIAESFKWDEYNAHFFGGLLHNVRAWLKLRPALRACWVLNLLMLNCLFRDGNSAAIITPRCARALLGITFTVFLPYIRCSIVSLCNLGSLLRGFQVNVSCF